MGKYKMEIHDPDLKIWIILLISRAGWRYRRIYKPKYMLLKAQIEKHFPRDDIQVVGRGVPGCGAFEVEIEGKRLIHSKRTNGFVDSPDKLNHILQEIHKELYPAPTQ